ncbi:GNAT family N-acetyltransferase [Zobellella iuensis]|uniref:GNAT family N-acetyltransferase n=1 Tax=Zobellella iuensis TaxID=2803811 RepID=A0ABS1QSF0_9GAMM|nr:GNAT family N-acetyltransferase [Zobellella iuensis]MBL1377803.1 GNAT family N-acetyltransferase [Zobellella iuensis]
MWPTLKTATSPAFARRLIRQGMAPYYRRHRLRWNEAGFADSWTRCRNLELLLDDAPIGILRLEFTAEAAYLRDLHLLPEWRNRGLGRTALRLARTLATEAGCPLLRLKVFADNPAVRLYQNAGFALVRAEPPLLCLEAAL